MVRLRGLRLLRRRHRPHLLPERGQGRPGAGGLRHLRRRLPHAAGRRRADRLYRRPPGPARRAHLLGGGDGHPDLPGRRAAGLRDAGPRRTDPAHAAAHDPGPVGWRRIHHLHRLHDRARQARQPRHGRRGGLLRRRHRHPGGLGDRRGAGVGDVGGGARKLGLAHSLRAGTGRRAGRLLPAPRHPRGREGQEGGALAAGRDVPKPSTAIAAPGRRFRSSTRSAST